MFVVGVGVVGVVKKRIEYIDLLRVLATFAVVLLHVSAQNWHVVGIDSFEWKVFNIYDSIVRWAVPIFVMISGTLFLSSDYSIKEIYLKKILRIITAFLFWSLLYALILNEDRNVVTLVSDFLVGSNHMWFLFMIVGLYMLSPILKKITESDNLVKYFLVISFIVSSLLPWISDILLEFNNVYGNVFAEAIKSGIDNLNIVFGYAGYFVLGYYLNKKDFVKRERYVIYFLGLLGFVLTIFLTIISSNNAGIQMVTYYDFFSLNVVLEAVGIFVFAKYNFTSNIILKKLANISFGIYLVHMLVLNKFILRLGISSLSFNPLVSVPVIAIIVCFISGVISGLININPMLRRYIV